jgi:fatty acid desaturase
MAKNEASMTLFKSFTLKWWQGALFKWGMLALGIAIGAYWHDFFDSYLPILLIVAAACLTYVTFVWWKQ